MKRPSGSCRLTAMKHQQLRPSSHPGNCIHARGDITLDDEIRSFIRPISMDISISRGHDLRLHLLPLATRAEGVPFGDQIFSRASPDRSRVNPTVRENAERPTAKKIWECVNAGEHTFSDRPCSANAVVRQLAPVNRMEATAPLPASYQNESVGEYPHNAYYPSSTDETPNNYECQSLIAAVDAIHERMRHHYSNSEGNFYRGRLHDISDRQYELHCLR